MEIIFQVSENEYYYIRRKSRGFGYEYIHFKKVDGKRNYNILYHTYDINKIKEIKERSKNASQPIVDNFPSNEGEIPPLKILFIEGKNGRYFYEIRTPEDVIIKVSQHLNNVINNIECLRPLDNSNRELTNISEDLIKQLPESLQKDIAEKINKEKNSEKQFKENYDNWLNIKSLIENQKGNPYDALDYYYRSYEWAIVDLESGEGFN